VRTRMFPFAGPRFTFFQHLGFGVLQGPRIAHSLFGRLFIQKERPPSYFQPQLWRSPSVQLWQVTGDAL
jgi:hypothetical protein